MLSVEDREFLLSLLAMPRSVHLMPVRFLADRMLAREIASCARLGAPAQRALCLRIVNTPQTDNECCKAIEAAGAWLCGEVQMIGKAEPLAPPAKPSLSLHPADRFE